MKKRRLKGEFCSKGNIYTQNVHTRIAFLFPEKIYMLPFVPDLLIYKDVI